MRSAGAAALAGVAAAATALAVTEEVGVVFDRHRPTVVASVGSRLVVLLSDDLSRPAISLFGTNDKNALIVGIVVVSLLLGAIFGMLARHWPSVPFVGFAAFGLIGIWAAAKDPLASAGTAAIAVTLGVLAGVLVLGSLTRLGPADHASMATNRRHFLLGLAGTGAFVAVSLVVARRLKDSSRRKPAAGELPVPEHVTPVPVSEPIPVTGLPTYITPNERFYRIDTAIFVPEIDVDSWTLSIKGMVDHPRRYTYEELLSMRCVEEPVTLACVSNDVGGHLVSNARWLGIPLADLLGPAGVHPEATQIVGRAVDDFTVDLSTAAVLDGRVAMVAIGMNGVPLPPSHGYPARLVVAGFYGYASATKWLSALELGRREDHESFWVSRGWDKDGPIKTQSRIDVPASGQDVPAGALRVAGMAWAQPRGIRRVEVQLDRGSWHEATLGATASGNTWVQWYVDLDGLQPGGHLLAVRATDRDGNVQTDVPTPPEPSGATGYHYRGFTVV